MNRWIRTSLLSGLAPAAFVFLLAPASTQAADPAAAKKGDPAAAATVVPAPAPQLGARTWTLDGKKSRLVLQVFKDGAASALAHDHTVQATAFSGEVIADAADPTTARVSVTVQAAALDNDDPVTRKKYGLDPFIPDDDRAAVKKAMLGPDQLDVVQFPTIAFSSTAVEKNGDQHVLLGTFTLKGVSRPVRLPITARVDGDTLTGDGSFRFKQSDWGMKPYSALLGAVKNKDEVTLHVHLVGRAAP